MRNQRYKLRLLVILAALLAALNCAQAAPPDLRPVEGLRDNTPKVHALIGGKIVVSPGKVIERGTLVIRDSLITAVGADVEPPSDARRWDVSGKTLYPGFIDSFSEISAPELPRDQGLPHWNPNVQPQRQAGEAYKADAALNAKLRSQGFTARLIAPDAGIVKGVSALVTTSDHENAQAILENQVALHVRLSPKKRSRDQYPNSPMGAVALARQTFYDAQWYQQAWTAYRGDEQLPRPQRDAALESLAPYLKGERLVVVDALNELYFLRADAFTREFGLRLALRGSGNEYRRLQAIRETGRVVIVPVNFPKPPSVGSPEAALNVSLTSMMHWDIAPENPARLQEAGVTITLTTHGLKDPKKFLEQVRAAVKRGLSTEAAIRALTTTPAALYGVSADLGTLEQGKLANVVVADGDLFTDKSKVLETWVLGRRYEAEKPPLLDVRGTWKLTLAGDKQLTLKLEGKPEKLSGEVEPSTKIEDAEPAKLTKAGLQGARLQVLFKGDWLGEEGMVRLSAVVAEENNQQTASGEIVWPDGRSEEFTATHTAPEENDDAAEEGDESDAKKSEDAEDEDEKEPVAASYAVNYPLGAYGRDTPPQQPKLLLLKNATIWMCDAGGKKEQASLLIGGGKILAVGDIEAPQGAEVIDLQGKHITPGIIDCHSHMATDGGVNESTQAVTAEVRIGDFIDSDDIAIYQQLAGGVTSSNILHGSANPIGGQNQVIKLRWGSLPEEMKFAQAPAGIKFALGENVKQSNWGDKYTTRYPQSRMGVEQIVRDEFAAAKKYAGEWKAWQSNKQGMPPRRDLELDAIAEIIAGERWIHCHSYRQDEILALMRTLEDYGVQIGTFQHILEGYKVADAMAKHGAMGSAFADWWAYKFEVYDAIPYNGALMHRAGVVVSFNSDDRELARRLNLEAAKAAKYGGVPSVEALKFVTYNAARQLRIDKYVGSLETGKHADFVVWSGSPLSNLSRCEQTWIDGRKYFDRQADQRLRDEIQDMRNTLVQKILKSGQTMLQPGEEKETQAGLWPREDIFCRCNILTNSK